jgi:putative transposase
VGNNRKYGVLEIFNTDQVNIPVRFTKMLLDNGAKISMDGKGHAIDNIFIERMWNSTI